MMRLAAIALILPLPAMAHVGDHGQSGWWHFVTEADHLAFAALAVAGAFVALRLWGRR
jgi:hypothetical protein